MKKPIRFQVAGAFVLTAVSAASSGQSGWTDSLGKAVKEGGVDLDFRYRSEYVDQEKFAKDANASTLRSRITFESGNLAGFNVLAEIDNVTAIGSQRYNSTANGNTDYPVVADPEGTDINQVLVKWVGEAAGATFGRQRIKYSNQRFVGGAAWRQNEQTFDGFRATYKPVDNLSLDYSHTNKVHRVFGPDEGVNPPILRGSNHFLYAGWNPSGSHTLAAFAYLLDFDSNQDYPDTKTTGLSSDTYGLEYMGKVSSLAIHAAYARQSDAGDNSNRYDADYYVVDLSAGAGPVELRGGYEVLGAGDGVGFATPLAALHKFQGWSDRFLATPGDGVTDLYAEISGNLGPVKVGAIYHAFQAEEGSEKFGKEIDFVATWLINKQLSTQLKVASFTSRSERFHDAEKVWFTLQLKL